MPECGPPLEIERKFLVADDSWRANAGSGKHIQQGYFDAAGPIIIRVRIIGEQGFLTLKSDGAGAVRLEFEYEVPLSDAQLLLNFCRMPLIDKVRFRVPHAGFAWIIDVFAGDNAGLVLAEIELSHEHEEFDHPPWLGAEVTDDPAYRNANL